MSSEFPKAGEGRRTPDRQGFWEDRYGALWVVEHVYAHRIQLGDVDDPARHMPFEDRDRDIAVFFLYQYGPFKFVEPFIPDC